jgi:hypothetical protein
MKSATPDIPAMSSPVRTLLNSISVSLVSAGARSV